MGRQSYKGTDFGTVLTLFIDCARHMHTPIDDTIMVSTEIVTTLAKTTIPTQATLLFNKNILGRVKKWTFPLGKGGQL